MKLTPDQKKWIAWIITVVVATAISIGLGVRYPIPPMPEGVIPLGITNFDDLTLGEADETDTTLLFDGNAQDFYISLDDSADDLLIGLGSAVGTTPGLSIDENLAVTTYGDLTFGGTTPVLTVGDAGAEDAAIVFDGAAQDFHVGLDDSADDLVVGLGSALGTTPAFAVDEDLVTTWTGGTIALAEVTTAADTLTAAQCGTTIFLNSATEYTTTLPAISTVSAGCEFRFIVKAAPASDSYLVITGNSLEDTLLGGINELEVDTSDDGPYDANADTITFVDSVAVVGDFVYMISDGAMFYVSGQANADGGITITDED